jgi:capsid portal protein
MLDRSVFVRSFGVVDEPQQSRQVQDSRTAWAGNKDIIPPVYDPAEWAELCAGNARATSSINIICRNVLRMGWEVAIDQQWADSHKNPSEGVTAAMAKAKCEQMLRSPFPGQSFAEACTRAEKDRLSTGSGYIECIMDSTDRSTIIGLRHAPAKQTRRTGNGDFVQVGPTGQYVYFTPLESHRELDSLTGKEWEDKRGASRANRMIQVMNYGPEDPYYGVPVPAPAQVALMTSFALGLRNYRWFKNDTTPKMGVVMTGGKPADGNAVADAIAKFVKGVKGGEHSRVLMLHAAQAIQGAAPPTLTITEFGKGQGTDTTYDSSMAAANEEIRECFGLAKIFYGTSDDVNRASALTTMKASVEGVFWPTAELWEGALAPIAKRFHPALQIHFVRQQSTDKAETAEQARVEADTGAVSINELRETFGWEPITDDDLANVPLALLRQKADPTPAQASAFAEQVRSMGRIIRAAKSGEDD